MLTSHIKPFPYEQAISDGILVFFLDSGFLRSVDCSSFFFLRVDDRRSVPEINRAQNLPLRVVISIPIKQATLLYFDH
jgi:hypothetical protein